MKKIEAISKYGLRNVIIPMLMITILMTCSRLQAQRIHGLRVGVDLLPVASSFLDTTKSSYEVSLDYEVYRDIYAVVEGGYQSLNIKKPEYTYQSAGTFYKIGADYNRLKTALNEYHMGYIGVRYAFSNFSQEFPTYVLKDDRWGAINGSVPKENMSFHWAEIVAGLKGELLPNFYLGWSIRFKFPISKAANFDYFPYDIPGFGDSKKNSVIAMNYTISYKIPMFNKTRKK